MGNSFTLPLNHNNYEYQPNRDHRVVLDTRKRQFNTHFVYSFTYDGHFIIA